MCENCRDEISSQGPSEKESNSREGSQHYLEKTEPREDRVTPAQVPIATAIDIGAFFVRR